jgi:serpin B
MTSGSCLSKNIKSDMSRITSKPILEVTFPKAYGFEDYDTEWQIREQYPVDEDFQSLLDDFSYRTGSALLKDNAGKNINFSPLSLYYALAVASTGAGGDTRGQMLDLLGASDSEYLSVQCKNLYNNLYKDNEIGKLRIANSIWMDNDMNGEPLKFKDSFVENAAKNLYATSHSVDFSEKATGKAMAAWISDNTNRKLSSVPDINPDQILSIINIVYFYDEWIDRFDKEKTAEDIFHLSDGKEVKCDFMNRTYPSHGFSKGEDFTRSSLSLKNASRMIFILPDEGIEINELLSSPERMREAFEGGEGFYGKVVWKVPKFSFGSKLDLSDTLKELGVKSAFSQNADFSGITDHMAFISNVLQETHIGIDENGVEAAAFTRIDYAGAAMPKDEAEMILDRPFIYGIVADTGGLLFVGICENPTGK